MNIGLVLSGGMAKGAFQIGALRALRKYIPLEEIKYMSCSSIGVLNGYAFAVDRLDKAEQMWKNICNEDARFLIGQILRSSMLQNHIVNIHDNEKMPDFPFYCALLDMNCRNIVYKDLSSVENEQISQYLKASVAMPIYNRAVKIDGAAYFDGAMVDNIPVYPLLNAPLDYVICIYFDDVCYKFENACFDKRVIKITFPCSGGLKRSLVFKQDGIEKMIRDGYERTVELIEPIFLNGYQDLEYIYQAIGNTSKENRRLRITGDVLVTNLNKITQQLAKRKIM